MAPNERRPERRRPAGARCDNLFARGIAAPRRRSSRRVIGGIWQRMATRKAGKRIGQHDRGVPGAGSGHARTEPAPNRAPLVGVAQQVRAWADSVLGIAGAAADVSIGAARAILVKPEQRAALAKAGVVLRGMREAAGLSLQGSRRGDQPQGSVAARAGRERQGCAAVRDHPAPRLGTRTQRPDLVRDALHALVQSRCLAHARGARGRALRACRRDASANSPTSTAAATPRAASPTRTSRRCSSFMKRGVRARAHLPSRQGRRMAPPPRRVARRMPRA